MSQIAVIRGGEGLVSIQGGTLGSSDPRPVTDSTLFNAFSVTKPVVALALLQLIDQGLVALTDKVAQHWPAFGSNVRI